DEDNDARDPMNAWSLSEGHGTATASVLISQSEGDVLGSAPRATLMPIRAITSVARVSQVDVAEGVNYAVANGAHVITMNLGGLPSISLGRAIKNAVDNNVIVLAAAGNCIRFVIYPARYDDCMAVGGSNRARSTWRGSCRGSKVAFSAPAENVYRARAYVKDGKVEYDVGQGQGTSFAVALVAGVAACWLSHHRRDHLLEEAKKNGETLQQMFNRLASATAAKPPGWSDSFGSGIVNAEALLRAPLNQAGGESAVRASTDESFADSIRALAFEATKDRDILDASIDWKVVGPEVALSIFDRMKKTARPVGPEEAAPPVSANEASAFLQETIKKYPGLRSLFTEAETP
ncbi:MAG: S8/S53 family peptidase, partial [Myxococcota bacterium]